eukprot:TRINITY_DN11452_c0_g1_i2.p1 TRINITY_DN11452_c0_g1~~TRINITY_DN11452_c0_g1_i2.p1  ORF type:complete len:334 (+),score=50.82 TRINITY_DN11452_c0_g1_i2:891-1892(+)
MDFAEDFGRMMNGVAALGQMTPIGQMLSGAQRPHGPQSSSSGGMNVPVQPNSNTLSDTLVNILGQGHGAQVQGPQVLQGAQQVLPAGFAAAPMVPPAAPAAQAPVQGPPLSALTQLPAQGLDRQSLEDAISRSSAFQSLTTRVSSMETQVSQHGEVLGAIRTRQEGDSQSLSEILSYIRGQRAPVAAAGVAAAGDAAGGHVHGDGHGGAGQEVRGEVPILPVLPGVQGPGRMPADPNMAHEMFYEFHIKFCLKVNCGSNKEAKFAIWEGDDTVGIPMQDWLAQISRCKSKQLWRTKFASLGCGQVQLDAEEDVTKIVKMGVMKLYTELNVLDQ